MKTGIYKILNIVNNKFYIGSSGINVKYRLNHHRNKLKKNIHVNKHLQSAWNKYGEKSFIFTIIEYCKPKKCIEREQFYFDTLKPQYNKCPKAGSVLGHKFSKEAKKRLSESKKGFKHSEETKKQMSISHKGINTWMKGRKLSKETREKISKSNMGKKRGPTGRPAWNRGIPFSKKTCKKMSKSRVLGIKRGTVISWNKGKKFPKNKPVLRCDGKKYKNISEAAKDLNVKENTIIKACTDKKQLRKVKKFILKYIEPEKK